MKKILGWIISITAVVGISIFYHGTRNFEDTVVDDIDLEGIVEIEANANNKNEEKDTIVADSEENNYEENIDKSKVDSGENKTVNEDENTSLDNKENTTDKVEIQEKDNTKIETMAGAYSMLNNKTNAWGFVRKAEGLRPEFHGPYTKVLDSYEGIYCGNNDEKVVYLTFDEGYENGYTVPILDSLKEKDVTAVFFVTMPYVKQNPELIKRMIDENHIVGNHISRTSMYHIKIS